MNAVDYLKVRGRMTDDCHISCEKCLLDNSNNGAEEQCVEFEYTHPEQAVEIVEKWAKENPVKTYLSVLLEKLPNVKMHEDGEPHGCPSQYFKTGYTEGCYKANCKDCWNREYKEVE